MTNLIFLIIAVGALILGSVLGYFARQSIAKKQANTIEAKLHKRISQVKKEAEELNRKAQERARRILEKAKRETEQRSKALFENEQLLLKRENAVSDKASKLEEKEKTLEQKIVGVRRIKREAEELRERATQKLEKVADMSKTEAKGELLKNLEDEYKKDLLEKMRRLESGGIETYENKAREIIAQAIQKYGLPQTQEITTTNVSLPSDEIKGRVIGKEGRNIKTLEKLTGVEIIIDDTPESVTISGFDPVRRHIAKESLERLVRDGRIQPARIEETVENVKNEIAGEIRKAGEKAVYETGIINLDPKIVQLLGRLKFRTSYGQNVLLHSIEVSHLAGAIAEEIGADAKVARKAGLLHDVGKAVDHQIEGSHVNIGIKILEKFGVEKEVIDAMKSHHEEYPYESLEAIIIQTADQISGARPGARKDSLENYLRRLSELENIAANFPGVEKAYAIQAGREIRVFVKPEEIDDYKAKKMAKEIAKQIQEELKYPGEIKVVVIRENRAIEYAK